MRILTLTVLTLTLTGSVALAMPGATVGIPVGSPDPFGTMRRDAEPPATSLDEPGQRIERRPRKPRLSRHRVQKARR